MKHDNETAQPAPLGQVARGVGRPAPERASECGLTECQGKPECARCEHMRLEGERLAFEAWMAGHCWALGATWNGSGYISDREGASCGSYVCPQAMQTRRLWAAWRDRAALARHKTPNA
jgi:hypothetical protein